MYQISLQTILTSQRSILILAVTDSTSNPTYLILTKRLEQGSSFFDGWGGSTDHFPNFAYYVCLHKLIINC